MHAGYLVVETHATHPGLVRIREADQAPATPAAGGSPRLRYAAYFDDLDAARMHAHDKLRRRLVDVDTGLYRSDLVTAVAAVEAINLRHRQIYVDPDIGEDPALTAAVRADRARQARVARVWQLVGVIALLLLIIKLLLGS